MEIEESTMSKKKIEIIITIIFIAIIVFAGLNVSRYFSRIDITENKIYTISEVSKDLFEDGFGLITITYFRSKKLKDISPFPVQIEDMLYEYAAFSKGNIKVKIIDPIEEKEQHRIEGMGIYPQQIE